MSRITGSESAVASAQCGGRPGGAGGPDSRCAGARGRAASGCKKSRVDPGRVQWPMAMPAKTNELTKNAVTVRARPSGVSADGTIYIDLGISTQKSCR